MPGTAVDGGLAEAVDHVVGLPQSLVGALREGASFYTGEAEGGLSVRSAPQEYLFLAIRDGLGHSTYSMRRRIGREETDPIELAPLRPGQSL